MECKTLNTLFELPHDLFDRVKPLYAEAPFDQPCYDAVFEGKQAARIFVDDADAPKSALMCRSYEYFAAGTAHPLMRQFIKDAPEEAEVFASFYGYVPLMDGWKSALLSDLPLEIIGRCNFQWQPGTPIYDWHAAVPEGANIVQIDSYLARRLDAECYPVPFILYDWGSYEAYTQYGFGFALFVGEAVASSISATAVSQRHALITIATEPPFRKQGFATLLGARFIEETLQRGLIPTWDCDDFNTGSVATARKLGFKELDPFVELALPNRAKPEPSRGLWSAETRADGVTLWHRIP
ncbi:MAG: GNAT family N-acetyltransferase [Chloroflexi bacterium]|nr:GNAT family N-acetyltransferase [Chloroflexota bacterium]